MQYSFILALYGTGISYKVHFTLDEIKNAFLGINNDTLLLYFLIISNNYGYSYLFLYINVLFEF